MTVPHATNLAMARTGLASAGQQEITVAQTGTARLSLVDQVDGYRRSIQGVDLVAMRSGRGIGPNIIVGTRAESFTATSITVQFPMLSRTTVGDDTVLFGSVVSHAPGANWCGIDLKPGMNILYGPGAEHTASNPTGLRFVFAAFKLSHLAELADGLRLALLTPPRGEVHVLQPTPRTLAVRSAMSSLLEASLAGVAPDDNREDALMHMMTAAMSQEPRVRRIGSGKHLDDRRVVLACVEYAEEIGRVPTIPELCAVSYVSDRRLRIAFARIYGIPPLAFFRRWALNRAHDLLQVADPETGSVTDIAMSVGFAHLGRFAGHYKGIYGDPPSKTLSAAAG